MSRFLRSAASLIGGTLLTLAALGSVALVALSALGIARFVPVLSNSMAPQMPTGSVALVLPVPREDIAVGDTIVFTAPDGSNRRVIHRVLHRYGTDEADKIRDWTPDRLFLETQGDNNPAADPWILTLGDASIWRHTATIPHAGWPAIWLADPTARFAAFGVGGAVIATWALVAIWRTPHDEGGTSDTDSEEQTKMESTP